MSNINPEEKANELLHVYNPRNLIPFPFGVLLEYEKGLDIRYLSEMPSHISGAIFQLKDGCGFAILINSVKPKTRQYFTLAHELGHFYLHNNLITEEKGFIDETGTLDNSSILFRDDLAIDTNIEREANRFAASLIMPESSVKNSWDELKSVDKCAELFGVSVLAMSIRLEKLGIST